jgi:hypothetical protein
MTLPERLKRKADEYRVRAAAAAGAAANPSTLAAVRAGHVRSEQRWLELADAEDARLRTYHAGPPGSGPDAGKAPFEGRGLQLHSGRTDVSAEAVAQVRSSIAEFDVLIAAELKDA